MGSRTRSEQSGNVTLTRRQLLKGAAVTPMTAVALSNLSSAEAAPPLAALPPITNGESLLLRMQREAQRAMQKPVEQRRWVIAIDTRRCVGWLPALKASKRPLAQRRSEHSAMMLRAELAKEASSSAKFSPW